MPSSKLYNRPLLIDRLRQQQSWQIVVIGGGATGLGVALDAASRGLKTLLLEQHDFAKGTSSRSTKLIHGGVRYLAQGDLKLVYSALRERNILWRNAPHLVKPQSFIIPCYTRWEVFKYGTGLKLYDLLAGRFSFGKSSFLGKAKVIELLPNISRKGLKGGIRYFDGRFDDARLAINIAQTAIDNSAVVLNYFRVTAIHKENGRISGVSATDMETGESFQVKASIVVNATGVFVDDIIQMDEPRADRLVTTSQGVHLVVDNKYLNGTNAMVIPKTSDGRILFAVPWYDHLVLGTTDTLVKTSELEPQAKEEEIQFIFDNLKKYLAEPPSRSNVLSVFAGLRPLAASSENTSSTKELSRDHKLIVSRSGLITITGGKWTTYRKMAEDTVNTAVKQAGMNNLPSRTATIPLHGYVKSGEGNLKPYGSDAVRINAMTDADVSLGEKLVTGYPYTKAEVVWSVRNEMARTIEDVLARRLRLLFINADAAVNAAPEVGRILMNELKLDQKTIQKQLAEFAEIASRYKLKM